MKEDQELRIEESPNNATLIPQGRLLQKFL